MQTSVKFAFGEAQKNANLVDFQKHCKMSLWSLSQLSIQPRASCLKFADPTAGQSLAEFDPEMAELVKEERDRQVNEESSRSQRIRSLFQVTINLLSS